jgi:hypothetical protein
MTHWCRDIPRDEAVRAAEDNRPGPLPTLEEAIDAVTERRPPEPGGSGNVTGLRTELVTLEVTHNNPWDINHWAWDYILRLGKRESVRVVEEVHFDDLANMSLERDAAIRERDAARARVAELESAKAAAIECVEEVRAQREAASDRCEAAETALRQIVAIDYTRAATNGASWKAHKIAEKALEAAPAASVNSQAILDGSPAASNSSAILTSSPAASGAAGTEPVAWGVRRSDGTWWESCRATRDGMVSVTTGGGDANNVVSPLYAAPQAASGHVEKKPMKMPSREWFERMASVDDSEMSVGGLASRVAELEEQLESVACRAATAETALESAPSASNWRMLKVGETVEPGDEMTDDMFQPWRDAGPCVGQEVARTRLAFRRRVPSPAASGAALDPVLRKARLRDESRTEAYVASLDEESGAVGTEPVAWGYKGEPWFDGSRWHDKYELTADERLAKWKDKDALPLYAAPQPAKGWLTEEERSMIEIAVKDQRDPYDITGTSQYNARVLRDLLARSSPPEVNG